jgi:predicted aconitase with swiveling domain
MNAPVDIIRVTRAFGDAVEGEAVVSGEGFSPRYDLDRTTGVISKAGHALEGIHLRDKILIVPTAKGGVAAGWAFLDIKDKGYAPKALVFGKTNPVMVQGAVFAEMTITEGWSSNALEHIRSGDIVRVDPAEKTVRILRRKA